MTKFDFSKSSIQSDEELAQKMESSFKDRPYLDPGTYEVVIKSAKSVGTDKFDKSWEQFEIVYEDAGKKTLTSFVQIPTNDFEYKGTKNGKPSMRPFGRVKKLVHALTGQDLTARNAGDVLTTLFSKPEKGLVGKTLKITVGYERMHVAYKGKDEIGQKKYVIQDGKTGAVTADDSGKTLFFPEMDAAKEYAAANNISLQKFADVTVFERSVTAKSAANW